MPITTLNLVTLVNEIGNGLLLFLHDVQVVAERRRGSVMIVGRFSTTRLKFGKVN
jgi:hypothetical protein